MYFAFISTPCARNSPHDPKCGITDFGGSEAKTKLDKDAVSILFSGYNVFKEESILANLTC